MLEVFGKQRAVYIPNKMLPYGSYFARRESILRALFRPKSKKPPIGWVYLDMEKEITQKENLADINDLAHEIGNFFVRKKSDLLIHMTEKETCILKLLEFDKSLNLSLDNTYGPALFGWGQLKTDFVPDEPPNTIIEAKYVRTTTGYNECDIKNALSQIIEQALCKRATNAILVVIDAGRAKNREWNDRERNFIGMFKENPFGIHLRLVRIRVQENIKDVSYSIE